MRGLPRIPAGAGFGDASLSRSADASKSGGDKGSQGRSKGASESVIDLCSDSEKSFHDCSALGDDSYFCIIE